MRRRFNSFPKRSNENAKHVLRQLIPIKCSHRVQGKVGASRSLNLTPELFRQSAPDAHAKTVTVRSGPSPFFGIQIKIFTDRRSEVAPRDRAFACVRPEHGAGADMQRHAHRVLQVRSDHWHEVAPATKQHSRVNKRAIGVGGGGRLFKICRNDVGCARARVTALQNKRYALRARPHRTASTRRGRDWRFAVNARVRGEGLVESWRWALEAIPKTDVVRVRLRRYLRRYLKVAPQPPIMKLILMTVTKRAARFLICELASPFLAWRKDANLSSTLERTDV